MGFTVNNTVVCTSKIVKRIDIKITKTKGHKESLGGMGFVYGLVVVMLSQMCTSLQINQIVHIDYV